MSDLVRIAIGTVIAFAIAAWLAYGYVVFADARHASSQTTAGRTLDAESSNRSIPQQYAATSPTREGSRDVTPPPHPVVADTINSAPIAANQARTGIEDSAQGRNRVIELLSAPPPSGGDRAIAVSPLVPVAVSSQ
jgi:hypothetical protein